MSRVYRKKGEVIARKVAGEGLLIPVRGKLVDMQNIFVVNPVAEYIWSQLDGVTSLEQIEAGIISRYEVEIKQAGKDLAEFIEQLQHADLLEPVDDGQGEGDG